VSGNINPFKAALSEKVELRDLGPMTKFLSMNVAAKKGKIVITQYHCVREIVDEIDLTDGKVRNAPLPTNGNDQKVSSSERVEPLVCQAAIGKLLYLSTLTRPDVSFAISKLSQKNNDPTRRDWNNVVHVVRYLEATERLSLVYEGTGTGTEELKVFCDADWGGDDSEILQTSYLAGAPVRQR